MQRRKFIRTTAAFTMLSSFSKMSKGIIHTDKQEYDDIKKQSIAAFKRFETVWNFNDFWKRGNTFDACLCFADALHHKWPDDAEIKSMQKKIGDMLEENYTYFKGFDPGGLWADDFGWWGLMGIKARKHLLRLNNKALADKYFDLS